MCMCMCMVQKLVNYQMFCLHLFFIAESSLDCVCPPYVLYMYMYIHVHVHVHMYMQLSQCFTVWVLHVHVCASHFRAVYSVASTH